MIPILRDFPDHFETSRLSVRAPRVGDGETVYQAVVNSLEYLRAWPASLPWALHEPSVEESEAFCRQGHANFLARTDLPMLIFLRETSKLVGCTGLHRFDWSVPKFEVGFWGHRQFHRQGLITEAVRGVVQFALTSLMARRIECFVDEANMLARGVAERSGFSLEGVMVNERKDPNGILRNTCVYALAK